MALLLMTDSDDRALASRFVLLQDDLARYALARWAHLLAPLVESFLSGPWLGGAPDDETRPQYARDELLALCCRYRLPLDRTAVEVFAAEAPGLALKERKALAGWTGAWKSLFEIVSSRMTASW